MFKSRKLLIASMHKKEQAIAPTLERELGVTCFINENFDTDALGTFTGEIERTLDPISTAREKCLRAMRLSNCDLGVASEGSFGPHPSMFFINADEEFLIFIDQANRVEIMVRELSTATNFNAKYVEDFTELLAFAGQVSFPSHGLILRPSKEDHTVIYKGITDLETLKDRFERLRSAHGAVYVETDMRAMHNPSRMKVIERAAQRLAQKIKSVCPQCQMPGFDITDAKRGLECELCGSPTNSILSYTYVCQHCQFTRETMYPDNKTKADPAYCDYCNP